MKKNRDIILDLIQLADFLDERGLYSFAEDIDEMAKEYHQKKVNPHFDNIFILLKKEFIKAVSDPNKSFINEKSLPEILSVLNSVQQTYFMVSSQEYYIPEGTKHKLIPSEFYELAGNIAELMIGQKQLTKEIEQEKDENNKSVLKFELRRNNESLIAENKKLEEIKNLNQHSYEIVKQYINSIVNKTGEKFEIYPKRIQQT